MKFSLLTLLLSYIVMTAPLMSAEFSVGMTSYGGNLMYFAAGPTWVAPCNDASSAARQYLESKCKSSGYTGPVDITRDQVIDSGHLGWTGEDLEQRENGHEMYCMVEATALCTKDLESPTCSLRQIGPRWHLFKRDSLNKPSYLVKRFSKFKDFKEAREESIRDQAAYGCKFVENQKQIEVKIELIKEPPPGGFFLSLLLTSNWYFLKKCHTCLVFRQFVVISTIIK